MTIPKNFLTDSCVIDYTLPKLHKCTKEWYIDFYCYDPVSDMMKRKKYMLSHFGKSSEKEHMAAIIIKNVVARLQKGWNPWVAAEETRHLTSLEEVFEKYEAYLQAAVKKNIMRQKTVTDYLSRLRVLCGFMEAKPIRFSYQLDTAYVMDFLDYLLLDRDVTATSRNNYRTWLSTLCNWMVSRKYLKENPAADIRSLPEVPKFRQALSVQDLKKLGAFLRENNKSFLLACMFQYYTLIRPTELSQIRLRDISIKHQTVFVAAQISKNRKDGLVALNDAIIKLMIDLHIFDADGDCYLFGKDLRPSRKRMPYNKLRIEWSKVRIELKFPESYQFYSLKDSGVRDLGNAEGVHAARNQARHSDLSITNRYVQDFSVLEGTKHFEGNL